MGLPQVLAGFLKFHRVPVGHLRAGWARSHPSISTNCRWYLAVEPNELVGFSDSGSGSDIVPRRSAESEALGS